MERGQLTFDGHEIDRVIEFLDLIKKNLTEESDVIIIESVRCEARTTLLTVEDNKVKATTHDFIDPPELTINQGYRRTLRFRQGPRTVDFGGANAIREEWRLERITFRYSGRVAAVTLNQAKIWIEGLLPSHGRAHANRDAAMLTLGRLRLVILGVTPCPEQPSVIAALKAQLLLLLRDARRTLTDLEVELVGALLVDLRDREFIVANAGLLLPMRGRHSFALMRQMFVDESLEDEGTLSQAARTMLQQTLEHLDRIRLSPTEIDSRQQVAMKQSLTFSWQVLEAISFASTVNDQIHNDIGTAIDLLARLEQNKPRGCRQEATSALSAAVLCYASLFRAATRKDNQMFQASAGDVRKLLRRLIKREGVAPGDVTLRIAAMASLAMITEEGPVNVQAAFKALERSMSSIDARQAQERSDKDDEIAAGADACGLLFKKVGVRRLSGRRRERRPGEDALRIIADHWDRTLSDAVRRACARNILEGLWNGMPSVPVVRGLRADSSSPSGSLRAHRKNPPESLPIDLPSQALLLTLDDWTLLPKLVASDEYQGHPECLALSGALRSFVEAEEAYSQSRFDEALDRFEQAATAVRNLHATFLPDPFAERLAAGIEARAACCRMGQGEGEFSEAIEGAIDCYARLHGLMIGEKRHEFDPDFWLTRVFEHLLSGVRDSKFWEVFEWTTAIEDQFRSAITFVPPTESPQLSAYCHASMDGLVPRRLIAAILGGGEHVALVAPETFSLQPAEWIAAGLKLIISYAVRAGAVLEEQSRGQRVRALIDRLPAYKLRPVGIVGVGQALQW